LGTFALKLKIGALKIYKSVLGEVKATYCKKDKLKSFKVTSSNDVNQCIRALFPVDLSVREAFVCLYLNRNNRTIGYAVISIGGTSFTVCDPKVVFQHALLCNASSIVLIHNHPSGNIKPSLTDIELTKRLKKIGEFMSLEILDHLIIVDNKKKYYSFADRGML